MINIIIFACVCLTAVLFLVGFLCFYVIKMNQLLSKMNRKLIQNDMMMQLLGNQCSGLEAKIEAQLETIKAIPKKTASVPVNRASTDGIEHNYERAKSLLKRGMPLDRSLMMSCNMTEEEFELLSETMETFAE